MRVDPSNDIARLLAEERRGRLAAERLLDQKQAELRAAYRKLDTHARHLSAQVSETRAEVQEVRSENERVMLQLGEATEKIEVVEGQLWQALTTIRDGFAMFDADLRMELANPAYLALFDGIEGIGPGVANDHILDVLSMEGIVDLEGEHPEAWRDRMRRRWTADPIPDETLRLWNGRFIKLNDRWRPQGGIVTLAVDITDLMRMWSAVDELPDGFVLYDDDDRLVICNRRYRELYATSAPVIVPGATFEDILRYGLERGQYVEAVGREAAWLEERLARHREAAFELEQPLRDGRWLRVYERETRDGGRVGLRVEITQLKRDQQCLRDAMGRAEAANRAKSAFLANMSHEIRTPMNGVIGMADLMMESGLSDDQRIYVETIRASGEALLVIINDILDYSKIEADRLELRPEPFDLERAIHDVLMLVQPAAREKGLALLVDYDMFLPTRFVADPGRVRQVLTNLIGNAVKFTHRGHVLVRVIGVPGPDDAIAIHLTVEDTGIGIPADRIDDVFTEFTQVEDDRDREFEGTGLGLSITRRLVGLMGGEVWAESELGTGSCFGLRVVFPPAQPPEILGARVPDRLRRALVSVDAVSREILGKQLAALGLPAAFHDTCDGVLDALGGDGDDVVVIVAVPRPDPDGAAFAHAVHARAAGVPVLLVSDEVNADAMPEGVHALLTRPLSRRALFAAIEAIAPPEDVFEADTVPDAPPADAVPTRRKLDVLVAEDNRTNQLVFRKMAAAFDIDLRFAGNGEEAVAAFRAQRPDIVFMDISMPVMDGKAATAAIRALEGGGPRVPIIAVTAHAMAGDREAILQAGLDDYLTKPLRKAHLAEKLRAWGGTGHDSAVA